MINPREVLAVEARPRRYEAVSRTDKRQANLDIYKNTVQPYIVFTVRDINVTI